MIQKLKTHDITSRSHLMKSLGRPPNRKRNLTKLCQKANRKTNLQAFKLFQKRLVCS